MARKDPRYVIGARVQAKAHHVTALAECHRRYGANAKTKFVNGTVVSVDAAPSRNGKRPATLITADYELGGGTIKRCQLNSRGVKLAEAESTRDENNEPVTALGTGNVEPTNEAIEVGAPSNAGVSTQEMRDVLQSSSDEEPDEMCERVGATTTADTTATIAAPRAQADQEDRRRPVAIVHYVEWRRASSTELVRNVIGEVMFPGATNSAAINGMSALDFFLLMFPPKQLITMVDLTNAELSKWGLNTTNSSEMLKFFGILILTTSFEFTSRASLWSSVAPMKYRPAPHFGLTGMSKHRFDVLFRAVRWSKQPPQRADNESTEQYRWKLVDDFVANFNDHRANFFSPSDTICVDESMSRWYGQGGHWINQGLPQYVAIDRKPENGCEIQNAACGRSGVMLRLKLVKGIDLVGEDDNNDDEPNESSLLHGTQVLKSVVSPWFGSNRIVCADSYFASVGAAKELYRNGLRFIGVVKTATKGFPKTYLTSVELHQRGDFLALASDPADELDPAMAAFVWMDRERRYFIATAGSLSEGTPYTRCRWRQVSQDPNAPPEKITMTIKQPQIAELYYTTCGAIDRHNRYRQDDLRIEKKVETKDWSVRVNLSIFAMIVVDTWLVYNAFKNAPAGNQRKCLQKEFYSILAEELIDNSYDSRGQGTRRTRSSPNGTSYQEACIRAVENGCARAGVLTHLTPVKRLKNAHGEKTSFRYQGRCKECQKKTTWQCSDCNDNEKVVFLCATKNGKRCFLDHIARNHAHLDDF
jgi:hypothetical protein